MQLPSTFAVAVQATVPRLHWSEQVLCWTVWFLQAALQAGHVHSKVKNDLFLGNWSCCSYCSYQVKVLPFSCYSYDIPIPEISGNVGALIKATGGFLNHFSIFLLGKWASLLVLDFFFPTFSEFTDNFQADYKEGLSCIVMMEVRYVKSLTFSGGCCIIVVPMLKCSLTCLS